MKKRLFLLTYSFILITSLQAQIHYFVEASGNKPLIPNSEKEISSSSIPDGMNYTMYSIYDYNERYEKSIGGNIMVGLHYDLKNDFSLESGADLSLIKFNQTLLIAHTFMYTPLNNNTLSTIPPTTTSVSGLGSNYSLSYLSIPVSVFYQLLNERLYVGAGVVPGVLIHTSNVFNNTSVLSKLSVAAQIQVRLKVTEKVSVIGAFQQYLSPIFKEDFSPNKTKNRLVKLGLRYDF